MRVRCFLLGVLVGVALAPASGRVLWLRLRDTLAATIDSALRMASYRLAAAGRARTL